LTEEEPDNFATNSNLQTDDYPWWGTCDTATIAGCKEVGGQVDDYHLPSRLAIPD
jgi:hypothetical protein